MPVGNVGKNVSVRYKVQPTAGTPVTGGSGEEFRIHEGAGGLNVERTEIVDPESRDDGMTSMSRQGSERVTGGYPGTLSVGTFNTLIAALFRNTWTASATALTCDGGGTYTSLAVTNQNTLTLVGSGSFLTQGVRVGKVIRLGATASNDSINAVVATVSANVITVLGTPWTNFTADTNATLTITKYLTNSTTLTRSAFTFEEVNLDLDESEQFEYCRVISMDLEWMPNGIVKVTFGIRGRSGAILGTASSPGLTSPTEYVSIGLIVQDASLYIAGTSIATITGGKLMFNLGGDGVDVVGSRYTPDIYEGNMQITGDMTAIRTVLATGHLARFLAETDNVELSLLFVEPDASAPIDFFHVFIPRLKYMGDTKQGLGTAAPLVENIKIMAAVKATTTGYDATMATLSTSV
jgi:hypothetical protein